MTDPAAILSDATWLPYALDIPGDRVQFVRATRETHRKEPFLADYKPADGGDLAWLPGSAIRDADIDTGPIHFIFHSSFCRSTLLTRALDLPGIAMGYCEPGIVNHLAYACDKNAGWAKAMAGPIGDLLSRPLSPGEAVVVKPSNIANRAIPLLLEARPDARAVVMSGTLRSYLDTIASKGFEGRVWARRLHQHLSRFVRMETGLQLFLLTDMQIAGLVWLLHQHHFASLLDGPLADRIRTLTGDAFNADRAGTLEALGGFFDLAIDSAKASEVAAGPVFAKHSKYGTDFDEGEDEARVSTDGSVMENEISRVADWIESIAQQLGIAASVSRPLLAASG